MWVIHDMAVPIPEYKNKISGKKMGSKFLDLTTTFVVFFFNKLSVCLTYTLSIS